MTRWKMTAAVVAGLIASGAQAGTDIMFCGSTSRTGANLYLGAGPYTESYGCNPDAAVQQAMLVSRSGSIAGNGPAWLAYLNAGGIIITEYSISDNVYNEIYGTAYPQGSWYGNCADNAMPQVKLNPTYPFWTANSGLNVTPAGEASCGYDISAIIAGDASIVPLGESTGATYFGYKPQGSGHFYLLDADWQDNESSYTDDSRYFMGALISSAWVEPVAVPLSAGAKGAMALLLASAAFFFRRRVSKA